jgi:hypothetical protein
MAGQISLFSQEREVPEPGFCVLSVAQQDNAIIRQTDSLSSLPGIVDQRKLGSQRFGATVSQLES